MAHTTFGNYFSFKVYEPKERIIQALPYKDRIVQQWYVEEFIKPYIIPRFIDTTFACIDNKGTHKAVNKVQEYMRIFKRNNGDFWILKIKYLCRYMDDFIIILKTKQECIKTKALIEKYLEKNLKLELNAKSRYYPYKMGVDFCGYRIFTTHKLLRISSKKKIKKKVKNWNYLYKQGNLDINKSMQSLNSWIGHSSHCNCYKLQQKILNNCNFLINNNFYAKQENELIDLMTKTTKESQ